ncbi:molecular chaperone DnaJ [Halomicronema hongdechloris C2206]|uniref:Molecular chaperone DnaJ n=1 Tax=Halomicronema hongdechloris C2206 TaxID=1641165 RepID=A0A1Z3HVE8_9CYAN|nr:DnaJ domain-containing protein [Halomicronema hongdechloris]ASC74291.1 molecular chaperone DnaJ [Halomicronema hongdechloris C2206]
MSLADHYRVLGLRTGASFAEVKASYRRLARRYHPDVNPDDRQAHEHFIQITQAYRALSQVLPSPIEAPVDNRTAVRPEQPHAAAAAPPQVQPNPTLSPEEQRLKQQSFEQLQRFFKEQRFPRAIALVEALAQRMPRDLEIRQWQAITYQRWGRSLLHQGQYEKANRYLHKALRTDPHNRSLGQEIRHDLDQLSQRSPPRE